MQASFGQPTLWQRVRPWFSGFDPLLLLAMLALMGIGLTAMYSAGFDNGVRFTLQVRNMVLATGVFFLVSQVPPQRFMALAVPLYTVGMVLLVLTALFGIDPTHKGARRWLNVGIVIQPSEILKIATPLMVAWWFQRREGRPRSSDIAQAFLLVLMPFLLVAKQPDLGTGILIFAAGFFVIFFAGLSWKVILPVAVVGVVAIVAIVLAGPTICEPDVDWKILHTYQKNRICTLLDPTRDPLGKGFHIIQGMIAIGSGGLTGKGFMKGTQTHLEFIPERTSDFIFAAYSEEFGLVGDLALITCYTFLIVRGLMIAFEAPTTFSRLMAGGITMSFFVYAMVNMGMVSGILPVVGVPLPFMSYGGTALVTLGLSLGILMSIARSRRLMQS
ncbi:rod shape-determining protein RodA [Sphaerotilus sp.]|uniref:rod shape-determining protein RodA n=1 Tax=Sphaerotilus sp. TaxID=2093942 RepID=UPI0025FDF2C1|nr:rod shape-determining protein RodA [Sphaerotilus sp.]